jgi:hypothetical protein
VLDLFKFVLEKISHECLFFILHQYWYGKKTKKEITVFLSSPPIRHYHTLSNETTAPIDAKRSIGYRATRIAKKEP